MKLICFPYAGGSSTIFSKWRNHHTSFEVCTPELAGRGTRIQDTLYDKFDDLLGDLMPRVLNAVKNDTYALFGHSLGGKIVLELAREIERQGMKPPVHLFISGRPAPLSDTKNVRDYTRLSDSELESELIELGGTHPDFFNTSELRDFFFPTIRNDFRLAEQEQIKEYEPLIHCDISVFFGTEERLEHHEITGWQDVTRGRCNVYFFHGGHFFINNQANNILQRIDAIVSKGIR